MALKGSRELRARLKAIRLVFKPAGKDWADHTAVEAKRRIAAVGAVDSGATRDSIRRRNATQRKATVVGHYAVNFIDAGTKAHDIKPKRVSNLKFETGGRTVFTKKVHKRAQPARPFKKASAEAGLRKTDLIGELVNLWNKAA